MPLFIRAERFEKICNFVLIGAKIQAFSAPVSKFSLAVSASEKESSPS